MISTHSSALWCASRGEATWPPQRGGPARRALHYGRRDTRSHVRAHTNDRRPDYLPPTKPYHLSELIDDLLTYASALLRPGGRLVFWLPTMNEDDAETTIPSHEHFDLVAHSLQDFGRWGRRVRSMRTHPAHHVTKAPQCTECLDAQRTIAPSGARPHPRERQARRIPQSRTYARFSRSSLRRPTIDRPHST